MADTANALADNAAAADGAKSHKHHKKDKKDKKDKKHKKHSSNKDKDRKKKDKKAKKSEGSDDGSSSDSDSDGAGEAQGGAFSSSMFQEKGPSSAMAAPLPLVASSMREGWMAREEEEVAPWMMAAPSPAAEQKRKEKEEEEKRKRDEPTVFANELNPHLRTPSGASTPAATAASTPVNVGDSGRAWRIKKLQRAQQQAAEEKKSLEDYWVERNGSLDSLHAIQDELEKDRSRGSSNNSAGNNGRDRDRDRDRRPDSRSVTPSRDYLASGRSKMLIPKDSDEAQEAALMPPPVTPKPSSIPSLFAPSPQPAFDEGGEPYTPLVVDAAAPKADLNKLSAKLLRAEMQGNAALVTDLKRQIEEAKAAESRTPSSSASAKKNQPEVVVIHGLDQYGRPQLIPDKPSKGDDADYDGRRGKKRPKLETHDAEGNRVRYFKDDDSSTLDDLVRKEKLSAGRNDMNDQYAEQIMRNERFQDNLDYMDEMSDQLADKKQNKWDNNKQAQRAREEAIRNQQKFSKQLTECPFCPDSPNVLKHLIIASGVRTYLALPQRGILAPGHCFIVPMAHVNSTLQADEDVWSEMRNFKKCLIKMFGNMKKKHGVIFMEMATEFRKNKHVVIEVVPMPIEKHDETPIYFKKAILDSDEMWAQNTKLVDTTGKGLRRSIPPRFPFFHVEFGLDTGFAHVIEDEEKFPRHFGKEVAGGMLEVFPDAWLKPKKQSFDEENRRVQEFKRNWAPYDWTKQLDETAASSAASTSN